MKLAEDTKSFADEFLDERNSVALLICVALGAGVVGLITHVMAPPIWISVTATFAWVLASPRILKFIRRGREAKFHGRLVSLIFASFAAVTVSIGYLLMNAINVDPADRVIMTGARDTTTERLPDGSVLALDALSTVRVNITAERRVTRLSEGEVIFNVAHDPTKPFVVETRVANVIAAGGKFRIAINTSVEIEVYEGVVQVSRRGGKVGAPMRTLQKGDAFRISLDRENAVAANRHGRAGARFVAG